MNVKRGDISKILRSLGLIYFTDFVRFFLEKKINKQSNIEFRKDYPDVVLPPDYLMYESFQLNYKKYYLDSIETAEWLVGHFKRHIDLENARVLDWGCGPGRVVRHMQKAIGSESSFYGTDYNKNSIEWCSKYLKDVEFNLNSLEAKLPYETGFFNVIYGISIFTHLSEQMHHDWYKELVRVLKPNGILFLTTQGDNFLSKMTEEEITAYEKDELVVRGKVKEGHRTYSAFHPKGFMEQLFKDQIVAEHIVRKQENSVVPPQDIWIVKKK